MIGAMPETQEMHDYCGAHTIVSEVEVIRIDQINEAFERLPKQDVKHRFVIGMSSLGWGASQPFVIRIRAQRRACGS
jgi:uncharacterized zinc-type alcohol dehydrogenase-like protein